MMTLRLDESGTPRAQLETTIRKLGFRPRFQEALTAGQPSAPVSAPPEIAAAAAQAHAKADSIWRLPKLRHAMFGGLLVGAVLWCRADRAGIRPLRLYGDDADHLGAHCPKAFIALRFGAPFTIQMLLTQAAIGALFIDEGEEAAIVVLLFLIGEVLEGLVAARARSGIKALRSLVPRVATVEQAGALREVLAASLRIGQVVLCRPGARIPADGVVVSGVASVDESPMTGESVPVAKEPNAHVFAGSINHEAPLRVRVDREASDNTIARIIALVEEAQDAKAPAERFIDAFSRVYMPLVVIIAALVTVVPPLTGLGDRDTWIYRGLALLLIGCPLRPCDFGSGRHRLQPCQWHPEGNADQGRRGH